jgi:hypothetical protein
VYNSLPLNTFRVRAFKLMKRLVPALVAGLGVSGVGAQSQMSLLPPAPYVMPQPGGGVEPRLWVASPGKTGIITPCNPSSREATQLQWQPAPFPAVIHRYTHAADSLVLRAPAEGGDWQGGSITEQCFRLTVNNKVYFQGVILSRNTARLVDFPVLLWQNPPRAQQPEFLLVSSMRRLPGLAVR